MTILADAEIRRRIHEGDPQMAAAIISDIARHGDIQPDGRGDYQLTIRGWIAAALLEFDVASEDMEEDDPPEDDDPKEEDDPEEDGDPSGADEWFGPWDAPLPQMNQLREAVMNNRLIDPRKGENG